MTHSRTVVIIILPCAADKAGRYEGKYFIVIQTDVKVRALVELSYNVLAGDLEFMTPHTEGADVIADGAVTGARR